MGDQYDAGYVRGYKHALMDFQQEVERQMSFFPGEHSHWEGCASVHPRCRISRILDSVSESLGTRALALEGWPSEE